MPHLVRSYAELTANTFTIAINASLSGGVELPPGQYPCGIAMPSAWTAADLTFQGSGDRGAAYANMYDKDGNELAYGAAASTFIALNPDDFWGVNALKIRSGTSGSAVNQAAARTITLYTRAL
jgi:hypothetical protein